MCGLVGQLERSVIVAFVQMLNRQVVQAGLDQWCVLPS